MTTFTRFGLVLTLALVLATGFGCAKKQVAATPEAAPVVDVADSKAAEIAAAKKAFAQAQQVITDTRIHFAFDKYDLSTEAKDVLKQKAEIMKKYTNIRVLIAGNCDDRGTQEYNLALGERRARAASDYMIQLGVNPAQIEVISYGKERPIAEGNNEAAWAMNRRDDFTIIQ